MLVVAPVLLALLLWAVAVLSGAASVTDNTFAVQDCTTAEVASVQRGTTTVTTSDPVDVAITSVDPARSFVHFSLHSTTNDEPDYAFLRVELSAADRVTITRDSDDATRPTAEVAWSVVEWSCGVSVQRGTITGDGVSSTLDASLDAVDPSRSFALFSVTPGPGAVTFGRDYLWSASIPDGATLRLRTGGTSLATTTVAWQVVELSATAGSVQQVTGAIADGAATGDLALGTAVDPGHTFVLTGWRTPGSWGDVREAAVRAELVDGSTLRATRQGTSGVVDVEAFVVTMTDGTTVQSGTVELVPTAASSTVSIGPVDLDRSSVLSTAVAPGGQAWGSTDGVTEIPGHAHATFELTADDAVTLTRSRTSHTSRFTFQAITWGGPAWWDPTYAQRQQISVDTTAAAAPGGYTVPVAFDHAALVAGGDALASGDDVRVLHFDGSTWTELDRVLAEGSAWDDAGTTLDFRTVDPVAADSSDGSYWLYLGNAAAGAPPSDPRGVYALDDDFEDGTLGQFTEVGPDGWYVADPWSWRVPLTIPAGSVGEDLTDFPVLVSFTSAALAGEAQADGSDLRFTAADGTSRLPHELVSYDSGTGAVEAWVRVSSVPAAADTDLWLYAGSSNAPAQQDVRETWDNGYVGVWHLGQDPSGSLPHAEDSSPEGRDGAASGTMTGDDVVSGRAGDALDLDGTDDVVDVGDVRVDGLGLTVSAWLRADAVTGDPVLVGRGATGAGDVSWGLAVADTGGGSADVALELDLGGAPTSITGSGVTTGGWHHVAGVLDGATASVFVDGTRAGGATVSDLLVETAGHEAALGAHPAAARHLDGRLDEVRVSSIARSDAWLAAEHATVDDPAAFVTVGTPETGTWFDQGSWDSRAPLTVRGGQVAGDLTDFPMLVDTTVPGLAAALPSGADVVVTDADAATRLDHELEAIDTGAGTVRLWVRVPTVASAADTTLFLYWGNASAEDWQDPAGVWGEDARAVLHLGETPDG